MSETASTPSTALSVDPTLAGEVPPHLWLRSGRPLVGTVTRVYLPVVLIATALIFVPQGPVYWGLIGGGVLCYFLFPVVVQGLLKPIERRVLAARRKEANGLLQEVRGRRLVRQFAPHAWVTLQEGRLHLRRGDGKAAARAFTETVRLSRGAGEPALVSAQAQALLVAEQPEQARELLQGLAKKGPLSASDRLHLGLALLAGKGNGREALEHVQAAASTLGAHPRVLAAMALALHRVDESGEALVLLQRAQDALGDEPDAFDDALVQRGVKLLRTVQKAQQKRERKVEPAARVNEAKVAARVATTEAKAETRSEAKPAEAKPAEEKAKSARRVKKEERRAARRSAKAERRAQPESGKGKKGKAAKLKPDGKAAKVAVAKSVEVKKPLEVTPVAKPVEVKPEVRVEAKPLAVTPVAKPVEAKPEVKVEAKPLEVAPVAKPVEAKPEVKVEAKPIEVRPEAKPIEAKPIEARPVVEAKPAARPVVPTVARPAPPAGTALFGSLGGTGAPRVASAPTGAPGLPRSASLPVGGSAAAVPRAMSGEPTSPAAQAQPLAGAPVLKTMSAPSVTSNPIVRPPAPAVAPGPIVRPPAPAVAPGPIVRPPAPAVASNPIVRPPAPVAATPVARPAVAPVIRPPAVVAAPSLTPAAVVSAAPAPVQAPRVAPSAPAPVLPPRPAAPVLPPAPVAVVLPNAPVASAAPARPSELAQVLPDTDDAWDDMLNALEADGPGSP